MSTATSRGAFAFSDAVRVEQTIQRFQDLHPWGPTRPQLGSIARGHEVVFGNGLDLFRTTLLPALESAEHEVILVTCFWAASATLNALSESLRRLSRKALTCGGQRVSGGDRGGSSISSSTVRRTTTTSPKKIRVRLCFSSRSLLQKLFHTRSPDGYVYRPDEWHSKLGLPEPHELTGLDLQVKSLFFVPVSILHPKLLLVDRRRLWMPSCNVSWESWLEGCVCLSGVPLVQAAYEFWLQTWGPRGAVEAERARSLLPFADGGREPSSDQELRFPRKKVDDDNLPSRWPLNRNTFMTILLPSPSRLDQPPLSNSFRALISREAPDTPLNGFLLEVLSQAQSSIDIFTPNLTSPPVLAGVRAALERGVDVRVVTNRRMMLLEQLLTAGTVTEFCVWKLVRWYRRQRAALSSSPSPGSRRQLLGGSGPSGTPANPFADHADIEAAAAGPPSPTSDGARRSLGALQISYYRAKARQHGHRGTGRVSSSEEPVRSHFKCTIVDDSVVVMGSGNMDRASWFTSQELGVAMFGYLAGATREQMQEVLEGRTEAYFKS